MSVNMEGGHGEDTEGVLVKKRKEDAHNKAHSVTMISLSVVCGQVENKNS